MTNFTAQFTYPRTNRLDLGDHDETAFNVSASAFLSLDLDVDIARQVAGLHGEATGLGTASNYFLSATAVGDPDPNDHLFFPHTGNDTKAVGDFAQGTPDINIFWAFSGNWGIDDLYFDGNPGLANPLSNGLNLDGNAIVGQVRIFADGLSGVFGEPDIVRPLTLTGPAVPTTLTLARMSGDAYTKGAPQHIFDSSGNIGTGNVLWHPSTVPGEQVAQSADDPDFQAYTYVNSDSSQVVIAFRGTVLWKTWAANIASFSSGVPTTPFIKMVEDASKLLAHVVADHPGAQITLTGHSLGGAIAQIVGAASGYSTVAFNAPGAGILKNSPLLTSALQPAISAHNTDPLGGYNVDVRTPGDWVSMQGTSINVYTIDSVAPTFPDESRFILDNHDIFKTVIPELNGSIPSNGFKPGIPSEELFNLGRVGFIQGVLFATGIAESVIGLSFIATALGDKWLDPAAGTTFVFEESAGSPLVSSVIFPGSPDVASFKVWTLSGDSWSAAQTVSPGVAALFAQPAHAIKFQAISSSGGVVALPDGYLFNAVFASEGQVAADLHVLNPDNFNGANVQTPLAGQATLAVNSGFRYTDAGNGALTVNGTASSNDTILLGSGDKTVNLGSGNDFVMVKAGASGNIALHGGTGAETILAGAANVTLVAGSGNILFIGGDDANANVGVNTIDYSALGAVNVNLSNGIIRTGNGAINTLVNVENVTGSPLGDQITGDLHANRLAGGHGADTLTGGGGDDRFVFALGDGADTVTDFAAGIHTDDRIDLTAFHATFANVLAHASQSGANTVFNFGGGDTLTLQNVVKTALSAEDFAGLKVTRSDFSANGDSDILWARDNGTVSIWDDGQIGNAHIIANAGAFANSWHIAGRGDFDGNGHNDVLWRNDNGAASIWDNGQIGGAHIIADAGVVPNTWHISGTGDFDGNGQSDILWRNDNGAASIWNNGAIGNAHIIANAGVVPSSWHISGTGDFDADGLSDILWRNDNGAVSIWDAGAIGNAHIIANAGVVPNSWHISGTGDFDGNGHDDILWRNDNGAVSIWDNGQIGGAHIIANPGVVPNSWHIADTGDYDGNGRSDILWRNDNGAVSIWDNGDIAHAHIIANAGAVPSDWHIV